MKKYIRATICLIYSIVKFCFIKIVHLKTFKFSIFSIVSPFTEIEVNKGGKLSLGKMIRIRSGSKIKVRDSAEVIISDNVSLNYGCMIVSHKKVTIGRYVQFGPNVLVYDHDHDFRVKDGLRTLKYKTSSVTIGDNVWIGANVVILKGTKVGNNCVIAAGSVIKGEYPDNSMIIQKKETEIIKYSLSTKYN